jgi:hypothetical protein
MGKILRLLRNLALLGVAAFAISLVSELVRERGIPALGVRPALPASLAALTCNDLKQQVVGLSLKNVFGAEIEVLRAIDVNETRRSPTTLTCSATLYLDNGARSQFHLIAEDIDSGEVFMRVEETP